MKVFKENVHLNQLLKEAFLKTPFDWSRFPLGPDMYFGLILLMAWVGVGLETLVASFLAFYYPFFLFTCSVYLL